MPLFKVVRTDKVSWDEYAGFVIRAAPEGRAVAIAEEKEKDGDWTASRVTAAGAEEVILADFNAG